VFTEPTVAMMVLPVHIGCDHSANRDELRAWDHRGEKAPGDERPENVRQHDATFDSQRRVHLVEAFHSAQCTAGQREMLTDRGVAIRAAVAASNQTRAR
jgi:hypothetical protein